jgi:hypothetical protein
MTINCIHTTTRGAHICFQTIVLYGCSFTDCYDINTLRMSSFFRTFCGQTKRVLRLRVCSTSTTVTSGHRIILMQSANVGIKSASASALGLLLSWAPICYLTGWLLNNIVIFWKRFYRGCLGKLSGSGWTRYIQEGGLDVGGADCMASSIAGSNSDVFFFVG